MKLCVDCLRCYEDDILSCPDGAHGGLISPRIGSRDIAGKYRLIKRLGYGGMGAVYEAIHLELNRPCAIKLLAPECATSDPQARTRLRQEALTECDFDHPNLVRLYDFGTNIARVEENGRVRDYDELYIVMELLKGQSLKHLLMPRRPLILKTAITIAAQLADGLAEIHSKRVIHRDLKPENVLLCEDHKGDLLVKIVDFGAVKVLRTSAVPCAIDLTKAMFIGSPVYASPENCKGEPLDERSDIYSLGLILYEMIAGRRAFEDRGFLNLLNSHAYEAPPPLLGIPKALADLTLAALEKSPALRPQAATEFGAMLRGLALGSMQANETSCKVGPGDNSNSLQDNEVTVVASREAESNALQNELTVVRSHNAPNRVVSDASTEVHRPIPEFQRVEIPVLATAQGDRSVSTKQKIAMCVIALTLLCAAAALSTRWNESESDTPTMNASAIPSPQPSPVFIARREHTPAQDRLPRAAVNEPRHSATPGRIILPKFTLPDSLIKPVSIRKFALALPSPKSKAPDKIYSNLPSSKEIQDILRHNRQLLGMSTTKHFRPTRKRNEFQFPGRRARSHPSVNPRSKTYRLRRR